MCSDEATGADAWRRIAGVDVDRRKIEEFLLNAAHPKGGSRHRFLSGFGYRAGEPALLARGLILHARSAAVTKADPDRWGRRFHLEGPLWTPSGEEPNVRTVWQLRAGSDVAWFVTLKPLPRSRQGVTQPT